MRTACSRTLMFALGFVITACGNKADQKPAEPAPAAAAPATPSGGMAGMAGMAGMSGNTMFDDMTAHLASLDSLKGASLAAAVATHRPMVANMLSEMDQEMRGMKMTADARWAALADSIRSDLVSLPDMTAAELQGAMPGHRGRVTRLIEMHKSMMGGK